VIRLPSLSDLGPVLESSRVRIEPIGPERALALLDGRPERELAWERGFPLSPLLDSLRKAISEPDGPVRFGPFFAYVVIRRADGLAVGDIGFHGPPGPEGDVEVGYALAPAARGAGLATESVVVLLRWAFAQRGVHTVSARVEPGNRASIRLLERLGFELDGQSGDHLRYVALAEPAAAF
jgi:RimJ/RimL family protein N-acetyltransferase